jgi:hypothetical protein
MKYLKIQNNGLLDIRLVALMGGTTKSNDQFKIGQFGTGLKYTLAFLFRNNLDFKIFSGTSEIQLGIETESIRGEDFEIICINGKRTSITTKMGEDWKAWMIIREIWCNALDEGEALKDVVIDVHGEEGKTSFFIQIDSQLQAVLDNWTKYFIHGQEPLFRNERFAIYPGGEALRIYKNGVLIDEYQHKPGLFSYDVLNAEINELREFKGSRPCQIVHALSSANEKVASYFFENISEKFYEGEMDFDWFCTWGQPWEQVLGSAKLIHKEALQNIQARGIKVDAVRLIVVPKSIYGVLTKQFEGIGALVVASKASEFYESYDEKTENKIKQGLTILEHCDYIMHPELEFVYGFFEDKAVLAQVNIIKKKVYISNTLLQKSLFSIVSMLIEENEHFNTGLSDESRAFQQHFIDLYARELLAKNEVEI